MNVKNKVKQILPVKTVSLLKDLGAKYSHLQQNSYEPELYNKEGKKIRTFYLGDVNTGHDLGLTAGRQPKYINWDRTRYTLPVHFYTDDMIWRVRGNPQKKFAILLEPETLQPAKYRRALKHAEELSSFDAVFTYSTKLLESLSNAKPFITGGVYIGTLSGGGQINSQQYLFKSKNISMVSSAKRMCELHELRYQLAQKLDSGNEVDCFGTFNGKYIKIWDSLEEYRYSIVIENEISDYWITERICNCFASMTVPIYLGSPKIGDYFNMDGIITIDKNSINSIDDILNTCNEEDYQKRLPAIKDNFERVKKYYCLEDWLMNEYEDLFK